MTWKLIRLICNNWFNIREWITIFINGVPHGCDLGHILFPSLSIHFLIMATNRAFSNILFLLIKNLYGFQINNKLLLNVAQTFLYTHRKMFNLRKIILSLFPRKFWQTEFKVTYKWFILRIVMHTGYISPQWQIAVIGQKIEFLRISILRFHKYKNVVLGCRLYSPLLLNRF